jgi:hypothetical protein
LRLDNGTRISNQGDRLRGVALTSESRPNPLLKGIIPRSRTLQSFCHFFTEKQKYRLAGMKSPDYKGATPDAPFVYRLGRQIFIL